MELTDSITLIISILALVGSFISIYFHFFHKPNSLLAFFSGLSIIQGGGTGLTAKDAILFRLPLTFINNGRRHNAIVDAKIFVRAKPEGFTIFLRNLDGTQISIQPGEVVFRKIESHSNLDDLLQLCDNKSEGKYKVLIGVELIVLTDKSERIEYKYVFASAMIDKDKEVITDYEARSTMLNLIKRTERPLKAIKHAG